MFFFKTSKSAWFKKSQELLEMADKVLKYRGDLLNEEKNLQIKNAMAQLALSAGIDVQTNKEINDQEKDKGIASNKSVEKNYTFLEKLLKDNGGKIYPLTFWSDNIEMLLVTFILAMGIRSFFIQPFKIPTNSMWPTYHGMVPGIYADTQKRPTLLERTWRSATLGATNYNAVAPTSGRVTIPLFQGDEPESHMGRIKYTLTQSRTWFGLIPTQVRSYTFYVNNQSVTLEVPLEFNLDIVIQEKFFAQKAELTDHVRQEDGNAFVPKIVLTKTGPMLLLRESIQEGQSILDFDILTGDMLFVDRFTYNFKRPKVGEAIVFHTRKIEALANLDGTPDDRYYIKRLIGTPGDLIEIQEPTLLRNGEPIEGSIAFGKNAIQEGLYPGYINRGLLEVGEVLEVPPNFFFALGDNSPGSLDGRSWGFVPEKEIVGRALFIFYPFTSRWGEAR